MSVRSAAVLIAVSLAVSGCTAPKPGGAAGQSGGQPSQTGSANVAQICSPAVVGLIATLACAAIAKGNDRVRAGAVCAAVAVTACYLANSYKAEQLRSAKQVEDEYLQRNRQLPERATITAYRTEVNPQGAVSKGQEVKVVSTIVAVPGRNGQSVLVEEELGIFDRQGEAWGKPVRKTANSTNQAGEFRTSFTIPISDGWSQGVYTLHRTLYVNGAVVQRDTSNARFQVVQRVDMSVLALAVP
jgi:hypothetical protein